jgi:hypothetical protein
MTAPDVPWSSLSPAARGEGVSIAWIGSDGVYWPLAGGGDGGSMGAFIAGDIEGMVHVPQDGVWTTYAYGPPRFERMNDAGRKISFPLGLMSDSTLGWYDTETNFWKGCTTDSTGFFVVTTRRHGQLWLPMQLFETPKCTLEDDPSEQRVLIHDVILAVDGEPRWRRPDKMPDPFISAGGAAGTGTIKVGNASTEPAWPVFFVTGPAQNVLLPDGPNAIITSIPVSATSSATNEIDYLISGLLNLFGIPTIIDEFLGIQTAQRANQTLIQVPPIPAGSTVIVDTDPTHRIAISTTDPVDNVIKQFVRNSDLLELLTNGYGATGLPYAQQFIGQGFSVPIPPNTVATMPVYHDAPGGKIWLQLPQVFESALA